MTETIQPDLDAAIGFLEAFAPDGPINLTAITPDGPVVSKTFAKPEQARPWLVKHAGHANIHFVVNGSAEPTGAGGRVNKEDIEWIGWQYCDVDLDKLDEGHPLFGLSLDERKAAKLAELEAADNPPTMIIDTGGGLQPLWALAEPVPTTMENVARSEGANRWLVEQFEGDNLVTDIGRLLRLPGTVNHPSERKRKRGRVVAPTKLVRSTGEVFGREVFGWVERRTVASLSDKQTDAAVEIEEVPDIDELVERYGLSERVRAIIVDGRAPGEAKMPDDSRDKWMMDGACQMVRAGVPLGVIAAVLLEPEWGISGHVLDHKGRPVEIYAKRQALRAHALVEAGKRAELASLGDLDPQWLEGGDVPEKPERKRQRRFKRYSITELLDLPDPVWTVEAILMERSLAMLYGSPKSFKTFLSLDLGLCIATGLPFHGHAVIRGTVTYVAAEGNPGETRNRVLAWCRANGVEPNSLEGWFKLVTTGAHLDNAAVVKEFIEEDPEPCDVTFIDTVNRSMAGDESSTKDMTAFVAGCDEVRRRLRTMVVAVHHSGVNSERERGSTVLRAAVDTRLRVTQKQGVVTLEVEDQRAGPSGERMYFRPVSTPVRDFDGPESVVMRPTEAPASKGYQDEGAPEPKRSADDMMLLRISEEEPEQYADLVSDEVKGFSKANVYKVRDRLIEAKLLRRGDRPALTKSGEERVKELLDNGE